MVSRCFEHPQEENHKYRKITRYIILANLYTSRDLSITMCYKMHRHNKLFVRTKCGGFEPVKVKGYLIYFWFLSPKHRNVYKNKNSQDTHVNGVLLFIIQALWFSLRNNFTTTVLHKIKRGKIRILSVVDAVDDEALRS